MQVEITPEPSSEEREVIAAALAAFFARDGDEPGAWWKAGVLENVDHADQDELSSG